MKKLEFKPEDFDDLDAYMGPYGKLAASMAQNTFDAWYKENIENAPTVFKNKNFTDRWYENEARGFDCPDTHKAKLVEIEEI